MTGVGQAHFFARAPLFEEHSGWVFVAKKGSKRLIAMIAVPLILVIGGGYFYLNGGRYEDTDNANVQQATDSSGTLASPRLASPSRA